MKWTFKKNMMQGGTLEKFKGCFVYCYNFGFFKVKALSATDALTVFFGEPNRVFKSGIDIVQQGKARFG